MLPRVTATAQVRRLRVLITERLFVAECIATPYAALDARAGDVPLEDPALASTLRRAMSWAERHPDGDPISLADALGLQDLSLEATGLANLPLMVRELQTAAYRRRLRAACLRAAAMATDADADPSETAASLSRFLDERPAGDLRVDTMGEAAAAWIQRVLHDEHAGGGGAGSAWTGLGPLDERVKGLRPGSLWVLGGRSGCRKSSMVLASAIQSLGRGIQPGIVSLEDGPSVWGDRIVRQFASASGADASVSARMAVAEQIRKLQGSIAYAIDATESEILNACRVLLASGARVLYVDYIQAGRFNVNTRRYDLAVAQAARSVKAMAARAGVPVVIASQLTTNRDAPHKEPTEHDLKESRVLLDVAEVVTLLWKAKAGEGSPVLGRLAKLKWGPEGLPFTLRIDHKHGVVSGADRDHPAIDNRTFGAR